MARYSKRRGSTRYSKRRSSSRGRKKFINRVTVSRGGIRL